MLRTFLPLALLMTLSALGAALPQTHTHADGRLYAANLRSSDVSVVALRTGREVRRISVAENPHELVSTPDGVFVTNYRSGALTRLGGAGPATTTPLSGEPHGVVRFNNGFAVTEGRAGTVVLLTGDGASVARITTGGEPHLIAAARGMLYVVDAATNQAVEIDPMARAVTRRVSVGRTPEALAVSPDGRTLAVANSQSANLSLIDLETFTERERISVGGSPVRVVYSPRGDTLAVSLIDAGCILLLATRSGQRQTLAVGSRPDGLAFDDSGTRLFVAVIGDGQVVEVRLRDRQITRRLAVGDGPSGLLFVRE